MRTLTINSPTDMIALLDRKSHFQQIEVNLRGNGAAQNAALEQQITALYRPCGCTQTSVAVLLGAGVISVFYMLFGMMDYSAISFGLRACGFIVLFAAFVKIGVIGIANLRLYRLVESFNSPNVHVQQTTATTDPQKR